MEADAIEQLLKNYCHSLNSSWELERLAAPLHALGSPHLKLPPVIHCAGTNGKGSTLEFMRSILELSGYKAHCFRSPHCLELTERFIVAGKQIEYGRLLDALQRAVVAAEGASLSFFDVLTLAAFVLFSEHPADFVLLEVGLGGRYDATNVIGAPLITLITAIGLDHQDRLGSTRAEIANEKAQIMKSGTTAFALQQRQEVMDVLDARGAEVSVKLNKVSADGCLEWETLKPQGFLRFEYQRENAALAVEASRHLKRLGYEKISEQTIAIGLEKAQLLGRMQKLDLVGSLCEMLPANTELWLDAAHNGHASQALTHFIVGTMDDRDVELVMALKQEKDLGDFLQPFVAIPRVKVYALGLGNDFHLAKDIVRKAKDLGMESEEYLDISHVFHSLKSNDRCRVFVCGSFHLIGDVLRMNQIF